MMDTLTCFLVGHLVGDYLLQNDWQANNKKRSSFVCAIHCSLWTASVMLFAWVWNPIAMVWLFTTHFAIDRTNFIRWWMTSVSGQKGFAEKLSPWSLIVVDNVFHVVTLYVAAKWLV